jgi:hypothetical protein
MPRPLFSSQGPKQNATVNTTLGSNRTAQSGRSAAGKVSLRKRSPAYMERIRGLDTSSNDIALDLDALRRDIESEFTPVIELVPIAFVSKCYLGVPFEVHELDMFGGIVEHHRRGEQGPDAVERARKLALHPSYVVIEVYPYSLVCVREDGSVSEVQI